MLVISTETVNSFWPHFDAWSFKSKKLEGGSTLGLEQAGPRGRAKPVRWLPIRTRS